MEKEQQEDGFKEKYHLWLEMEVRNFITKDNIKDTGCPLKLFKKM